MKEFQWEGFRDLWEIPRDKETMHGLGFETFKLHKIFAQTDDLLKSGGLMTKIGNSILKEECKQSDCTWRALFITSILFKDHHESAMWDG